MKEIIPKQFEKFFLQYMQKVTLDTNAQQFLKEVTK